MDGQDWLGLYRRIRAAVLRRGVRIEGACRMCGECCHKIVLLDGGRWLRHERKFEALCRDDPDYSRFRIVGKSEDGFLLFDCNLQRNDNFCSDHDSRPRVCRNYPTAYLYYRGGRLLRCCGYRFVEWTWRDAIRKLLGLSPPRFDEVLEQEIGRMNDGNDT